MMQTVCYTFITEIADAPKPVKSTLYSTKSPLDRKLDSLDSDSSTGLQNSENLVCDVDSQK